MHSVFKHLGEAALLGCLALGLMAPAAAASLREAVEQAWANQPEAVAQSARQDELAARQRATEAWTPEPPAVSLAHTTDQLNDDRGRREWEAEVEVPLWLPGQRAKQQATITAEAASYTEAVSAAKWRVAGEVREAYWDARLADIERSTAERKLVEAKALSADVERRVNAGDLPKVDLNQARSAEQAARIALTQAETTALQAQQRFKALTGLNVPAESESVADIATADIGAALDQHPSLALARTQAEAARRRLAEVSQNRRDNPSLSLALGRERSEMNSPVESSVRIGLRVPFASASRNQPRMTAAAAELAEAEARFNLERRRLTADLEAARLAWSSAQRAVTLAEERRQLASQSYEWLAKAFRLGELDLISRLRAENERFDAELAVNRAHLEAERAASRLNHALGVLP